MKRDFVAHLSNCATINKIDKIPSYASQFRKEWLCIRGINIECKRFYDKMNDLRLVKYNFFNDYNELEIFSLSRSKNLMRIFKRFLKAVKRKWNISNFEIEEDDVNYIDFLENELDDFLDLFCDEHSGIFNKEKYDNDDSGFREFYDVFYEFKNSLNIKYVKYVKYDSISESDIDSFFKSINDTFSDSED